MNVPPKLPPEAANEPSREALRAALAERDRELAEARARQSATAEILRVISQSPTDPRPGFDSIVFAAAQLLGCTRAFVLLCDGDAYSVAASASPEGVLTPRTGRTPIDPNANFPSRAIVAKQKLHVPDYSLVELPEHERHVRDRYGANCSLFLPLLRQGQCFGLLTLIHQRTNAFGAEEIALAESFRDQALIAIENARLFNEVQARTRDLTESLEQQTAAAEILRVISSSPTDLQQVFDAIARSASELCEGSSSQVFLYRNGVIDIVAHHKTPDEALAGALSTFPAPPHPGTASGRAILRRAVIHIPDIAADPEYSASSVVKAGVRTVLSVPMLRNGEPIGVINATRTYSRPYTDRQIELLKTFADQAVIAINNVGLFNETQEALKRQTATAEILKVIASSPTDVQPVFEAIAASANRLLRGHSTAVYRFVNGLAYLAALTPTQREADDALKALFSRPISSLMHFGRVQAGESVPIVDTETDVTENVRDVARLRGFRSLLWTPLMSNDVAIGMISVTRKAPGAFAGEDVQLLRTFADQAVIAINNVGLFNETQEALRQQTATADVLKTISRSAFDLDVVFDALLASAVSLIGGRGGTICVRDGDVFRYRAVAEGRDSAAWRYMSEHPASPGRASLSGQILLSGKPESIRDTLADSEFAIPVHSLTGNRSLLGVPLLRDDRIEGTLMVARAEPGPFDDRQIELLQTFADQAVIAIENVRLFDEVQARTRDLTEALQQQTATSEVLKVISRSAFDLQLVLDTLVQSAAKLCDAEQACVFQRDGDLYRWVSNFGFSSELVAYAEAHPFAAGLGSTTSRVALEGTTIHNPDVLADPNYTASEYQRLGKYRSMLGVPLLREGAPIGVFILTRQQVRPFTERQIELVQTFADQAVIAIENVRLFDEVQARTRDLTEALQQQTATADILKVIASSPSDVQPVFEAVADRAMRLLNCWSVVVTRYDGEQLHFGAARGALPDTEAYVRRLFPQRPEPEGFYGRCILDKCPVNDPDRQSCPDPKGREYARVRGFRAALALPMLAEGGVIGLITATRERVGAFAEEDVRLLGTFADQAAIAINNVSLFNETQEALKQQTATADVLKVISRSAFDLKTVLRTLVRSAVDLCGADNGVIFLRLGEFFYFEEGYGLTPEVERFMRRAPLCPRPQVGRRQGCVVREYGSDPGRACGPGV